MKITQIRTRLLAIPLRGRYHWAIGAPEGFNTVLIEVHTDDGIIGYGEALGSRSAVAAEATIRSVEHLLLGEDPFRVEYLLATMYRSGAWTNQRRFANQSFAGIEMALWTSAARRSGSRFTISSAERYISPFIGSASCRGATRPHWPRMLAATWSVDSISFT